MNATSDNNTSDRNQAIADQLAILKQRAIDLVREGIQLDLKGGCGRRPFKNPQLAHWDSVINYDHVSTNCVILWLGDHCVNNKDICERFIDYSETEELIQQFWIWFLESHNNVEWYESINMDNIDWHDVALEVLTRIEASKKGFLEP